MPGTPEPAGSAGGANPFWTALMQQLRRGSQTTQAIIAGQAQTNTVDSYGNTQSVIGQLSQQVTIGAAFQQPGVQVQTGLSGQGQAVQQNLQTGTVNATAGTNSVTIVTGLSGVATGYVIGAADVSDPSSGVATPAIVPGSVVASVVGSTINLTPPSGVTHAVAETGSGLYCAACTWKQQTSY